ncbi:MAK10-like protein [Tanacetum coccineum]
MGGSYYSFPCSILSTGKNCKTPQRYPDVLTTSWRISLRSMDSRTIDQSAGGKLRDRNAEESKALLEDLTLYDNESWNDPRDFAKPVKAISLPQDVPMNKITSSCEICSGPHDTQYCMENPEQAFVEYASSRTDEAGGFTSQLPVLEVLAHALIYNAMLDKYVESLELGKNGSTFVQGEVSTKMEDLELFTLPCRVGDSKPFDTSSDLGSCVNIIPLYLFMKLDIRLLEETDHIFGLADEIKSYPVGIVKDVKVRIGKQNLLYDFYVIDMKKDLETPLLVGKGSLTTTNAVIDCRKAKIAVGEGITRESYKPRPSSDGIGAQTPYYARKDFLDCHFPREWEIVRDAKINPFKDVLVFRRMVIFDKKKLGSS